MRETLRYEPLYHSRSAVISNTALITAASKFFSGFNATHYYTLTYGHRVSETCRARHFADWVDSLEWLQRSHLGWLRADECNRYAGLGKPAIPEHHHGILFNAPNLNPRQAEHIWKSIAGDALVVRYDPSRDALPYVMKQALSMGEWDIGCRGIRKLPDIAPRAAGEANDRVARARCFG